jgi:hypothetical protein
MGLPLLLGQPHLCVTQFGARRPAKERARVRTGRPLDLAEWYSR